ncbi:MAG TPA: sialidase family protein [Limnochordia bacterium]
MSAPPLRLVSKEPVFRTPAPFDQCHASTLAPLAGDGWLCAWFGGTREGAPDVAIWGAIRRRGRWSEPFEIARHPGVPCWNPVLLAMPPSGSDLSFEPHLWLFYRVGHTIPGWRSYVRESLDGGLSWSEPRPMPDGFLGPIKNKPLVLSDGSWLAGSSVETAAEWYVRMERSADCGATWTASRDLRLAGCPKGLIQPALWESAPGRVHALMRSRSVGRICRTDSQDGGISWSAPYRTDIPHNNSGIDVALLKRPGERAAWLALACNPVEHGRTPLEVWLSPDNGQSWPHRIVLEDQPGEYSYPAILATAQGCVISYTYRRERIEFARLAWDG